MYVGHTVHNVRGEIQHDTKCSLSLATSHADVLGNQVAKMTMSAWWKDLPTEARIFRSLMQTLTSGLGMDTAISGS